MSVTRVEVGGRPCGICHEIIPMDHARLSHANGEMCASHEGKKIDIWRLTVSGASCYYRTPEEAVEDRKSFKECGDKYDFRKVRMRCEDVIALGEFVGW